MIISELPTPLLTLTFGYTRASSLQVLRTVCGSFREVLDDKENAVWKSMIKKYCTPLVRNGLSWGKSLGTTALMTKASVLGHSCISCRLWFNLKTNKLYDVLLCGRCSKKHMFRVVTLKKACFNYFLDYGVQKENKSLVTCKNGRSFLVLLNHIRAVAFRKYPDGELAKKINARFAKSFQIELKKQLEKEKRTRAICFKFCDVLYQTPSRVDVVLRSQPLLTDMVHSFGSTYDVYGDALDLKVTSNTKPRVAAQHLYDYAAMLTYMRKQNLLDHKYDVTAGHRCTPNNVYRHHVNEGLHFYELVNQHADARDELAVRQLEVETYLLRKAPTQAQRKSLSVAMCAEESINYVAQDFQSFVVGQKGNPVEISRQVREREFLNHNHLGWEISNFVQHGYDQETARQMATSNVLHRTKGYPPMKRICFINLSTSPM